MFRLPKKPNQPSANLHSRYRVTFNQPYMRSLFTLLLTCSVFLFSCDNSIDADPAISSRSTTLEESPEPSTTVTDEEETNPAITLNATRKETTSTSKKVSRSVDDEIARQLELNPELPVLMNIAEAYDNTTVKMYSELADGTGGEAFMVDNATYVVSAITEIIKNYMNNETDLVFLIDKTGSMQDDIKEINKSVQIIIDAISVYPDARVGAAFYGDKYADNANWYSIQPLTKDLSKTKQIISGIVTTGGGDMPESVNDGIARTIEEMNWDPAKRRVILLIGDAPSLEKPRSDYNTSDIIALCREQDVVMNFYPVVIGIKNEIKGVAKIKPMESTPADVIASVSPNPATNMALAKTNTVDDYTLEVFDINGRIISNKTFHDNNCPIYTDDLPTGVYVIRITNMNSRTSETTKLVVKR